MTDIPKLLADNVIRASSDPAVSWLDGTDTITVSWSVYRDRVLTVARALLSLGAGPGRDVAILLGNTVEHLIADLAAVHCGAASISIYPTFADPQLIQVLSDARPAVLIVPDDTAADRIGTLAWSGRRDCEIVTVAPSVRTTDWFVVQRMGEEATPDLRAELDRRIAASDPDRALTYIYTSGTTGAPKGVSLTSRNILDSVDALLSSAALDFDFRTVSYLPLAHIVERLWSIYVPVRVAGHVICCPDPTALMSHLVTFHPTYFFGVPTTFAKLRVGVERLLAGPAMADAASAIAQSRATLVEHARLARAGRPVPGALAVDAARARGGVLRELRGHLGLDRVSTVGCGAAAMPEDLHEFWASLGVDVRVGYGMTENSGVVTSDLSGACAVGSVGIPLPGWQIRIADDGEVLIKGPGNTAGYRNRPDADAALYTCDGWLRTGDIGRVDETGRLYLTDRKKDLLVTAAGKNIAPTAIESRLAGRSIIEHVIVLGEARRYVTALITLEPTALAAFAVGRGLVDADAATLCTHPDVVSEIDRLVADANRALSRPEQIKRHAVIADSWSPESGELTPTMKLRRNVIQQRYAEIVNELYPETSE